MQFLNLTLETIASNLALDEALLLEAETHDEFAALRLWEWPRLAVVLGAGCRLAQDVDEAACLADGVSISRRSSGGGTVLLGSGCLCFSLVLPYEHALALREIRSSYGYILEKLRDVLQVFAPKIELSGTSDLAAGGRKFSGNAQQRKRNHLLHHGTILYDFDLAQVARYLRMPMRQPEYRASRPHAAFLMNLATRAAELNSCLRAGWQANEELLVWPEHLVRQLVVNKYETANWVRRR